MDNELSKCIRLFCNKKWLPDLSAQDDYLAWNNKIESVEYRNLKVIPLLQQMAEGELTDANALLREGANKRGNSSRLTQSFHFFMFEPIFSPVNALN
ncbi:hypothetical protein [Aeromonas rivipollensis]|uniref:hypothetical protein n=2 Tax=Aeromonas TaxID=642 RepID=UPI0039B91766